MDEVIAQTAWGAVQGQWLGDGCLAFRGVPFASSTAAAGRFRPPREPSSWTGVRRTTVPGPIAPQPGPGLGVAIPGDPVEQSEDCLSLDVFTPGCDDGARPVMVFLHGGGFVGGSAHSQLYDGSRLVREGVVLVSASYRLGALGWLAHPNLASEEFSGCGNWGLADQLAALEWVHNNIDAFGGDPDRVTVFGESAGSMCVASLLTTPAAGRLFQRAILQSGAAVALSLEEASATAERFAGELALRSVSRRQLESQPLGALLSAQSRLRSKRAGGGLVFQPVVDGGILAAHPEAALAAGCARGVDLLVGTNRDEWLFWTLFDPSFARLDEHRLRQLVEAQLEGAAHGGAVDADEIIEVFRHGRRERGEAAGAPELYAAIATDWTFRVPAARLATAAGAGGSRVFSYLFDWESPFPGGHLGACHALELPFVFGTWEIPTVSLFAGAGDEVHHLSDAIRSAWAAFARSGDPSCPAVGTWPGYDGRRTTMRLGREIAPVDAPFEDERAILERAFGPYGGAGPAAAR